MEWLLGGGTMLFGVSFVVLTFLNRKDARELLAARDRIEKLDEEYDTLKDDRDHLGTELDVMTAKFNEERDMRVVAESRLNQAWKEAREDAINRISLMDPAAAAAFGNRILSAPLPGVRLSETTDGHLEKP